LRYRSRFSSINIIDPYNKNDIFLIFGFITGTLSLNLRPQPQDALIILFHTKTKDLGSLKCRYNERLFFHLVSY